MKKYTLKLVGPGWQQDFYDKVDLQQKLYNFICEQCRCEQGITPISNISDMLATTCGWDFILEEE
jgi:hypothetical protein